MLLFALSSCVYLCWRRDSYLRDFGESALLCPVSGLRLHSLLCSTCRSRLSHAYGLSLICASLWAPPNEVGNLGPELPLAGHLLDIALFNPSLH